jgi:hypothetical protein
VARLRFVSTSAQLIVSAVTLTHIYIYMLLTKNKARTTSVGVLDANFLTEQNQINLFDSRQTKISYQRRHDVSDILDALVGSCVLTPFLSCLLSSVLSRFTLLTPWCSSGSSL